MKPTYEELAVQLANAESKCRELTAENAGLKNPENWLSQSDYGYEASEVATQNGATEDESLRAGMIAIIDRICTPATDAFLAEVRAQCLNAFIQHHSAELDAHIKNGGEQFDEKSVRIRDIIVSSRLFREQIRKEADQ